MFTGVSSPIFIFTRTALISNAFGIRRNVRFCYPRGKYGTHRR